MAFKNSTDERFEEQIGGSKLSLIQFSASWCGPCKQLKPIVEKISEDMAETFSFMMSDNNLILDMISKDEILNKKVRIIKHIFKKLDVKHQF